MTVKTKAKRASGSTVENDAAAAAGAATDARANAAGIDDPVADTAADGEGDTPEESVDDAEGVEDASLADADSADAADGDCGEHEGASSGENDEAAGNDSEVRDEDAPNDGGNADDGEDIADDAAGDDDAHPASTDEEEDEAEELWDLKVVLAAKQILMPRPIICQGDNCDLVACCIWSSNLDPETPWYSCLDCQEEFFGGWPANPGELPVKVLDDEWRNAMIEKCTLVDEPAMPNLPSSRGRDAKDVEQAASAEGGKFPEDADAAVRSGDGSDRENESSSDNDDNDDDEQGGGILWELTKIYNAKELRRAKSTMCSADDCDLVACSRWESNEGEKWFSCLDCQER